LFDISENIAFKKPATQNSGSRAAYAVDGQSYTSRYSYTSGSSNGDWLTIDLLDNYIIHTVVLFARKLDQHWGPGADKTSPAHPQRFVAFHFDLTLNLMGSDHVIAAKEEQRVTLGAFIILSILFTPTLYMAFIPSIDYAPLRNKCFPENP
jgi:hypothetical protein